MGSSFEKGDGFHFFFYVFFSLFPHIYLTKHRLEGTWNMALDGGLKEKVIHGYSSNLICVLVPSKKEEKHKNKP